MATATREPAAQRQLIEEQKRSIELDVDRAVGDVKELADLKSRLLREAPRIAAIGGAVVVLVGTSLVLRAVVRGRRKLRREAARAAVEVADEGLAALVAEIALLREEMGKQRKGGGGSGGLAGKIAIAAVTAAASAAGKQAANRIVDQAQGRPGE
ncbi:MAG TPA: hypothetical protein VFO60_06130 [Candidatus Dormibacteraeota bacterium]|nr:hypothetical protein [Candidatus Dormibacteraeota bacterium]